MSITVKTTSISTPIDAERLDLLDVAEAASLLGTPPRFVRRLIAERRIRFYKLGRYVRLDRADIARFIVEGRVEAALTRVHSRRA